MSEVGKTIALIRALGTPTDAQVASAVEGWLDDHPEATTTVEDGSITNAKLASSFVTPGTASAYSSSATYAVGDYCFHNGSLYRCITAITTAEAWTAAHWTAAVLGDDVGDLKSAVGADEALSMRSVSLDWVAGDFNGQGEEISSTTYKITDFIDAAPLSAKMNGATALYIYYYDKNKNHISHEQKNVDYVFTPNKVAGCKYYRLNTKGTNVPLLTFEAYSDSTFAALNAQNAIAQNQKELSLKISDSYERGMFVYATGKMPTYANDNFSNARRVGKYLRVIGGTTISVNSFSNGTLYCFEYDASKTIVTKYNFVKGSNRQLNDSTVWLRFEHDSYANEDVTITFMSPTSEPEWGFEPRINGDTIQFGYQVFPCYHTDTPDTVTTLTTTIVATSGLLMLPPNYTETGERVPVIYYAHGSADYHGINETEFSENYMDYLHYLRDEGYAIFDCYGWTNLYTTSGAQMANPTNMAAIKQGLRWVAEHYNVDISRVYVTGKSLGGLQAINMCYEGDFPIKACCPLAPALDAAEIGFGYSVDARKAYAADLCFSEDTGGVLDEEWSGNLSSASAAYKAYALANADKLLGYNPIYRNLIGIDAEEFVQYEIDGQGGTGAGQDLPDKLRTMSRICTIPTKIIMAVDDNACSPTQCSAYIQSIKNGGGVAEMRWMPANTGKHHAVDTDANALKVASITTKCGVTYSNVPLAYADMVQFFRRYS